MSTLDGQDGWTDENEDDADDNDDDEINLLTRIKFHEVH